MIESKLIPKALFSDKSVKSVNNLKDYAGIEYIASMNQTHSDVVTYVKSSAVYDSDGIYTEEPKLGLVVQTADCMPILLSDKNIMSDCLSYSPNMPLSFTALGS